MRTLNFFRAALTAAAVSTMLMACEKTEVESVEEEAIAGDMVSVKVNIPTLSTKLTTTTGEGNVNNVQLFVFNSDNILEVYVNENSSEFTFTCTSGTKDFYAVVNAPDLSSILTKAALKAATSSIDNNSPTNLVMTGNISKPVSTVNPLVEIEVSRLVARLSVTEITNQLSTPGYTSEAISLQGVFLSDVVSIWPYFGTDSTPDGWINKLGVPRDTGSLYHSGSLSVSINKGSTYTTPHYFYCLPNPVTKDSSAKPWCERFTRLVLVTKIKGTTYYYPIPIGPIVANHTYEIENVQINRLGSTDPSTPVEIGTIRAVINVLDWEDGTQTSVNI